jgi:hypothetical protein
MILFVSADHKDQSQLKIILVIFYLIFVGIPGYSQEYDGTIIRVIDGDTYVFLTAKGSFTVRMYGIDAPERDQPFSRESFEFLSKYLNKDAVTKVNGTDKEERSVGTLLVSGRDINLLIKIMLKLKNRPEKTNCGSGACQILFPHGLGDRGKPDFLRNGDRFCIFQE